MVLTQEHHTANHTLIDLHDVVKTYQTEAGGLTVLKDVSLHVRDGEFVRPVKVFTGLTDGSQTEIISNELPEGTEVVIGTVQRGDNAATTPNPFTPQMFGGKKAS